MNAGLALVGFFLDPVTPPPISGGTRAEDAPAVVGLLAYDEDQEAAVVFCSGTLVAQEAILTAAHCLDEADRHAEQGRLLVVASGVDLLRDGIVDAVEASAWVSHPSWQGFAPPSPPRFDVGVVVLERPLAGAQVAVLGDTPPSSAWQGERLELVGFGATSLGAGDGGTKRSVTVDYVGADEHFLFIDSPGANVCEGDSGGAMFRVDGGDRILVGVHSYVYAEDPSRDPCTEGQGASHRVDAVVDWIRQEAEPQGVGAGGLDAVPSGAAGSLDLEEPVACALGDTGTAGRRWWPVLLVALVWRPKRGHRRQKRSRV